MYNTGEGPVVEAKERMWWDKHKARLVPEGDPEAAFLYAPVGRRIPQPEADRLGIVGGRIDRSRQKAMAPAEDKEALGEEDKQELADENKAGGLTVTRRPRGRPPKNRD